MRTLTLVLAAASTALAACGHTTSAKPSEAERALEPYVTPVQVTEPPAPPAPPSFLIRGGTVMTADGTIHRRGYVVLSGGLIADVGEGDGTAPPGARIIDATGRFVTPGLIDTHSHVGVYAMPGGEGHADGNEMTSPVTPHVWAEHGFWPHDPGLWRALTGGITSLQVLPGSGNLIGGRATTFKLHPGTSARAMKFPGAPQGLKIACGENPKRTYGEKGREPMTRMGNVASFRAQLQKAWDYRRAMAKYELELERWKNKRQDRPSEGGKDAPKDPPEPPTRDLGLEALVAVLDGKMLVHNHCYRADEMELMLDVAQEFGFKIRSFHHALEAYKIAPRLAREGVAVSTWVDWWGFKLEAMDGLPQNVAMVQAAGGRPVLHSDSASEMRRLNQEAAKARTAGRRFGLDVTDDQALRWITANPAWALGVDDKVGTLARGKHADVVIWSGHPLSVYSLATHVFVDGHLRYDRAARRPFLSDFELGQVDPEVLP